MLLVGEVIIHVYTVCWNEEQILPFFLGYYGSFAEKIVVYDNQSSDKSAKIIDAHPKTKRIVFDTGGQYVESRLTEIRNTMWRGSRGKADWAMVVDMDEFLYHPRLLDFLKSYKMMGVTLPKIDGYEMASPVFPKPGTNLFTHCKTGFPSEFYSKRACFSPYIDMTFGPGSHKFLAKGQVVESRNADIKLLHYQYLGWEFFEAKRAGRWKRQSDENTKHGWGIHYIPQGPEPYRKVFMDALAKSKPVIS